MSFHQQIMNHIAKTKAGQLLLPSDFRGLGTDTAIKMSLSRISHDGLITRLSHGIYIKSSQRAKLATLNGEHIANAIAIKENIRICPSENLALFRLGWQKTRPEVLTFVTDGEPKKLNILGELIIFKATTPRKLSMANETVAMIVQGLEYLGKQNVDADLLADIKEKFKDISLNTVQSDIAKAPAWIYNKLFTIIKKTN